MGLFEAVLEGGSYGRVSKGWLTAGVLFRRYGRKREASAFSNRRLHSVPVTLEDDYTLDSSRLRALPLVLYEDRRLWNPSKYTQPARSFFSPVHRLVVSGTPASRPRDRSGLELFQVPWRVAFGDKDRTMICVRRKIRREVMFAKGYGGGPAYKLRPPHRTEYSEVVCK